MLKQFRPRFNRRFGVPAQCPEPAFRPLQVDLLLEQVLCFKHRRRVARDNTVRYQRDTLQLLPDPNRRSYAGAVEVVLEGLDCRLSVQHGLDGSECPVGTDDDQSTGPYSGGWSEPTCSWRLGRGRKPTTWWW